MATSKDYFVLDVESNSRKDVFPAGRKSLITSIGKEELLLLRDCNQFSLH